VPSDGEAPGVTLSNDLVSLSTPVTFGFFLVSESDEHEIVLDDGAVSEPKVQHVFTLASNIELTARASVSENPENRQEVLLKAELDSLILGDLTVKESDFQLSCLAQCLISNFVPLLNEVIDSTLKGKVNEYLEKGITFDFGKGLRLENEYLKIGDGILTILSDISVDVNEL